MTTHAVLQQAAEIVPSIATADENVRDELPGVVIVDREARRAEVAHMLMRGENPLVIAQKLERSLEQVAYDIRVIEQRWRDSAVRDMDAAKSVELAKIDAVEAEYWLAWEKSKQMHTSRRQKTEPTVRGATSRVSHEIMQRESSGDPRFLAGVMSCIDRRIRLHGLDAADRALTPMKGNENPLESRMEQYDTLFAIGSISTTKKTPRRNGAQQSVDSDGPAPEAGDVFDVG